MICCCCCFMSFTGKLGTGKAWNNFLTILQHCLAGDPQRCKKSSNPPDAKGNPTCCAVCDSTNHWSGDCPNKRLHPHQSSQTFMVSRHPPCLLLLNQPTKLLCSKAIMITPPICAPKFQNLGII